MELKYFNFYLFPLFRFFENPSKDEVIIYNQCASLRVAIQHHLKSKSKLPVTITFHGDVHKFLFKKIGIVRDGWYFLNKNDFPCKYFPRFWDHCAYSHGQGVKVFYPIKVRHFISWSPKKYNIDDHNPSLRAFQEKLTFIKVAVGDDS